MCMDCKEFAKLKTEAERDEVRRKCQERERLFTMQSRATADGQFRSRLANPFS